MSRHNRCDGWFQCPTCRRPDGAPVPDNTPDQDHPLHRCFPSTGPSCYRGSACCNRRLGCPHTDPCPEFIPRSCSKMPKINCTPNLLAANGSVDAWHPGPPAIRTCPRTQAPTSVCRPGPAAPCQLCGPPRACERPNDARYLTEPERCFVLKYKQELEPHERATRRPCNPPPPVPTTTCGRIGSRRLTEHFYFKYTYPGYESTPTGRNVRCEPHVPCDGDVGYRHSGCARKPVKFYMAQVQNYDD